MPVPRSTTIHRAAPRPAALTGAAAALLLAGCADDPARPLAPGAPLAAVVAPPAAATTVTVTVPASMRTAPFNVARTLTVPPGFAVAVHARVPGARFMAVAPNGDLLVSNPGQGRILRVAPRLGADPVVSDWATGLRNPHDVVFDIANGVTSVYVAESHQIDRFTYNADGTAGARTVVVANLPDASSPELNGAYGHQLKNIALDQAHNLYVSIASATNASPSDILANPVRAAVYQYPAGGGTGRLFARGLRNAEGLAMVPGTSTLWVVVNNRDNIAYPLHADVTGDGADDYGRVLPTYVDNHPPEEFTSVADGGNYGWPYCNPNPDTPAGLVDMPFDRDVQNNADGSKLDCATATRVSQGIQAHSAPLGLTFFQGTAAPTAYREGVAVALHGSWNRTQPTGYKVAYFPWDAAAARPGPQQDLVTGWTTGGVWGRPVDVAVDAAGGILVSDDQSGTIYRLTQAAPPAAGVASFTLIDADRDQPVAGYDPITAGATINLATLPTTRLNIRANTSGGAVGSVVFGYDATARYRVDDAAPFALGGDTNGNYAAWTPATGSHTVTATPYAAAGGTGAAGTPRSLAFTVTNKRKGPR